MTTTETLHTIRAARKASKRLLKDYKSGDATAASRIGRFFKATDEVMLARAQLVIAREHGYASWNELRMRLEK